jgi:hypothetical protein
MPDRYQTFRNLVDDSVTAWQSQVANPYITAYDAAYQSFKDTFDKQKESDKARAEMFIAIATIIPGPVLMSAVGSSSLRALANRAALQAMALRSATKTLAKYNAMANNACAKFAIGKVLDLAKDDRKKLQEVQKAERVLQRLSDQTQPLSALGVTS